MKRSTRSSANTKKQKKNKIVDRTPNKDSEDEVFATTATKILQTQIHDCRLATASCVVDFPFKKRRVRVLSKAQEVLETRRGGILYWMSRDVRVQDNWAFLFAQKLAFKLELPLIVVFSLVPRFSNATIRHYKFMLGGLEEVERECRELQIPFHLLLGPAAELIPEFVRKHDIGAVVCDFAPLRESLKWVEDVKLALPSEVPLTQVDAHNIVPLWIASEKQEYAAHHMRNKINKILDEFLTEYPPLVKHKFTKQLPPKVDWSKTYDSLECDLSVDSVDWAKPGYDTACAQLESFCLKRLRIFNDKRNDPTCNALSNLSPWFHFGQISVQRCILEIKRYSNKHKESVDAFCEGAIVYRQLADNFCYYNKNYDNLEGIYAWAAKTLNEHRKDKRIPTYTLKEFEQSCTHDDLWNSAQMQLVREGKMHGSLRMYWAKKILEWTETPELALEFAILLNNKYSLDGHDPNGYVGCMFSIGGLHDLRSWIERPIFGRIRYTNYQGCTRRFDVKAFVSRYGGKVHEKK